MQLKCNNNHIFIQKILTLEALLPALKSKLVCFKPLCLPVTKLVYERFQLDDLMKTLYATEPSFIRCVVPNTHKMPGGVEPGLVMHQYQCKHIEAVIQLSKCTKTFECSI